MAFKSKDQVKTEHEENNGDKVEMEGFPGLTFSPIMLQQSCFLFIRLKRKETREGRKF